MARAAKQQDFNDFLAWPQTQTTDKTGNIYCWGGQRRAVGIQITNAFIDKHETSATNKRRVKEFRDKQKARGFGATMTEYDCSGLGVYWLLKNGLIDDDIPSATMYASYCEPITKANLKKGDWVFRKDDKGKIYHVGYVVDGNLNVVEAMGRDDGVVKRTLNASGSNYWNAFGRPKMFKAFIEGDSPTESMVQILGDVNVRTGGSTKDKIIGIAKKGESYAYLGAASTGWHKINFKGVIGYVSNKVDLTKLNGWTCSRVIRRTEPLMSGDDVMHVKQALVLQGYLKTATKKTFGDDSEKALKQFQKANGLDADGQAGKKTIPLLGGVWTGK